VRSLHTLNHVVYSYLVTYYDNVCFKLYWLSEFNILQSCAAKRLRHGGILKYHLATNIFY